MKGIRARRVDVDVVEKGPRQLPSGRWVGCRHFVPIRTPPWIGLDPAKGVIPHEHDYDEQETR